MIHLTRSDWPILEKASAASLERLVGYEKLSLYAENERLRRDLKDLHARTGM